MSKTAFSSRYSFPVAAVLRVLTHFTNGLLATKYFLFSIRFLLTIIICRPEKSIKKREEQNTLPDTLARIAREYLNTIQARIPFPDTANNARSHTLSRGHQARPANISRKGRVGCCRIYPCRGKRQTNPYKKIRRKFYFFVKIRNIIYAIQNRLSCEPAFVYVLHIQREYRDKLHLLILRKA